MPQELHELLTESLFQFDRSLKNLGLYASVELPTDAGKRHGYWQVEWEQALKPALKKEGFSLNSQLTSKKSGQALVKLTSPESERINLHLYRLSAVKVRQFGSGYQEDHFIDHKERWDELDLPNHFLKHRKVIESRCCSNIRDPTRHVVLFLGFETAKRPFLKEIKTTNNLFSQPFKVSIQTLSRLLGSTSDSAHCSGRAEPVSSPFNFLTFRRLRFQ